MVAREFSRDIAALSQSMPSEADSAISLSDAARRHLESLLLALRDMEATVIIAAGALREEQELTGMCAARVLRTQVSNRLSEEIDRMATLFAINLKTDREYGLEVR